MKGKGKGKNKLSLVYNFIISSTLSYIYKYFTPSLINYLNEMSIFVSKNRFCVLFAKNISNYFEKTNNFIIFISKFFVKNVKPKIKVLKKKSFKRVKFHYKKTKKFLWRRTCKITWRVWIACGDAVLRIVWEVGYAHQLIGKWHWLYTISVVDFGLLTIRVFKKNLVPDIKKWINSKRDYFNSKIYAKILKILKIIILLIKYYTFVLILKLKNFYKEVGLNNFASYYLFKISFELVLISVCLIATFLFLLFIKLFTKLKNRFTDRFFSILLKLIWKIILKNLLIGPRIIFKKIWRENENAVYIFEMFFKEKKKRHTRKKHFKKRILNFHAFWVYNTKFMLGNRLFKWSFNNKFYSRFVSKHKWNANLTDKTKRIPKKKRHLWIFFIRNLWRFRFFFKRFTMLKLLLIGWNFVKFKLIMIYVNFFEILVMFNVI